MSDAFLAIARAESLAAPGLWVLSSSFRVHAAVLFLTALLSLAVPEGTASCRFVEMVRGLRE